MSTCLKNLIEENRVAQLRQHIFNQKLEVNSSETYTCSLSSENEINAVKQLISTGYLEWYDFLKEYIEHYPLSTEAFILLAQHLTEAKERLLVIEHLQKYGANEKESLTLFQSLKAGDFKDENLLRILCEHSRIFYQSLFNQLDLIDERWSHRYLLATKSNY